MGFSCSQYCPYGVSWLIHPLGFYNIGSVNPSILGRYLEGMYTGYGSNTSVHNFLILLKRLVVERVTVKNYTFHLIYTAFFQYSHISLCKNFLTDFLSPQNKLFLKSFFSNVPSVLWRQITMDCGVFPISLDHCPHTAPWFSFQQTHCMSVLPVKVYII